MQNHAMGSVNGIEREEVLAILEVSNSTLDKLCQKNLVRVLCYRDRKALYDPEEVEALKRAKEKGLTLTDAIDTSQEAWAAARVAQKRVEALERMLGLHLQPAYHLDTESVVALHAEAHEDFGKIINGAARVNYWADHLLSICEQYFFRVAEVTDDTEEPWRIYQELGVALLRNQNVNDMYADPEERFAYKRLEMARRQLNHSIFMYFLQRFGPKKAVAAFPRDFRGEDYAITKLAIAASRRK